FMVIVLAFVGVGIFTIPGAVIAAGFLEEIQEQKKINELQNDLVNLSLIERTFMRSMNSVKKTTKKSKKPKTPPKDEIDDSENKA
ncbi:MAG: hypothetical protein ACRC63_00630, partial [Metamycoplasmataceae bacterium]